MKAPKKPSRKNEGLSDAIQSLQHLLDDVGTQPSTPIIKPGEPTFDETGEFEISGARDSFVAGENSSVDIDSHFDMNIPPDLPDDEAESTDNIPTLSESIVAGEIPVLMEAVRLPGSENIAVPGEMDDLSDDADRPARTLADATEAAADAVQIILRRYRHEELSPEARQKLEQQVRQFLDEQFRGNDE